MVGKGVLISQENPAIDKERTPWFEDTRRPSEICRS